MLEVLCGYCGSSPHRNESVFLLESPLFSPERHATVGTRPAYGPGSRWHDRKKVTMKFLAVALIGVIAVVSGLVLNLDRPFLTNQSHISQAVAAETVRVNPTAEFTQKGLSKKPYRSLWNMFKSAPWRLSRHNRFGASDDIQGKCDGGMHVI